ncbi:hypothetical protein AKN87_10935 [Thiopseudomonas alkaliphila]|nr:hypothetical protein AKN87_10935 [Thiopseudomonas alkaliphila]
MQALLCSTLLGLPPALVLAEEPAPAVANTQQQTQTINLNQADAETLAKHLSGIGMAKAQAIIAYREANGPLEHIDELLELTSSPA